MNWTNVFKAVSPVHALGKSIAALERHCTLGFPASHISSRKRILFLLNFTELMSSTVKPFHGQKICAAFEKFPSASKAIF